MFYADWKLIWLIYVRDLALDHAIVFGLFGRCADRKKEQQDKKPQHHNMQSL